MNAILDDASKETFLNENVANTLRIQDVPETSQSMPAKVEIESVNQVTGSYKVEDWSETKKLWPHLLQCEFPKSAPDDLVDLLVGVNNAELHYSKVDVHGPLGGPTARPGPLGWTCIGQTGKSVGERQISSCIPSSQKALTSTKQLKVAVMSIAH